MDSTSFRQSGSGTDMIVVFEANNFRVAKSGVKLRAIEALKAWLLPSDLPWHLSTRSVKT